MEVTRSWSTAMLRCVFAHSARPGRADRRRVSATGAVIALLMQPDITRAQTPSAAPASSETVQEIIVTATRREERLLDVPVSTAVLSGATLQVLGSAGQDIR